MEVRTRSGRVVKKPERYTPIEQVEDDFSDSDLESHWDSDISSEISYDPEEIEESETDLSDFVAEDDENNNESDDNNGSSDDSTDDETDAESVGSNTPTDK